MFHLSLQKDRNISTLYEKVHGFLGKPVYVRCKLGVTFAHVSLMRTLTASYQRPRLAK